MTRVDRIDSIIRGVFMVILALLLIFFSRDGLSIVLMATGISMALRGIGSLVYFFSMARSMVGGKMLLYRGILYLDFGIFTWSLMDDLTIYIIIYIAVLNLFASLTALLRARESKRTGAGRWMTAVLFGVTNAGLAAFVLISGLGLRKPGLVAYIYGGGLIYSACLRILSSLRKTDMIYIQ